MCKSAEKLIIILLFLPATCFGYGVGNVVSGVHSPQELSNWLSTELHYQAEIPDSWQSAEETLRLGKGDCEDFAILSSAVLDGLKIPNQLLIIKFKNLKASHAICVFKENELCAFMSNEKMIPTHATLVKDAIEEIYPDWEAIIFTNTAGEYLKVLTRNQTNKTIENQLETALRNK